MARGRNNNKMTKRGKTQPAVLTLSFLAPQGESYVDLWLAASIANRRFYKQSGKPAIAGMTLYTNNSGVFSTFVMPDTWIMDNAYTKTRALWDKMNDQVLDEEPSISGKYHDFKILIDAGMSSATIQTASNLGGTILTPLDELGNLTQAVYPAENNWDYSKLQIPNDPVSGATTEYFIHAVGADTPTSKGAIAGYALSRSRPLNQEPNVPTVGGWMNDLFDVGEQLDELRENIEDDNDRPPYAYGQQGTSGEKYPGGSTEFPGLQVHDSAIVSGTTIGGKTSIPGCMPQCGLLKFNNQTGATATIQIHLMPGNHRGYYCEEM